MKTLIKLLLWPFKVIGIGLALTLAFLLFCVGLFAPVLGFCYALVWLGVDPQAAVIYSLLFAGMWAVLFPAILATFD